MSLPFAVENEGRRKFWQLPSGSRKTRQDRGISEVVGPGGASTAPWINLGQGTDLMPVPLLWVLHAEEELGIGPSWGTPTRLVFVRPPLHFMPTPRVGGVAPPCVWGVAQPCDFPASLEGSLHGLDTFSYSLFKRNVWRPVPPSPGRNAWGAVLLARHLHSWEEFPQGLRH